MTKEIRIEFPELPKDNYWSDDPRKPEIGETYLHIGTDGKYFLCRCEKETNDNYYIANKIEKWNYKNLFKNGWIAKNTKGMWCWYSEKPCRDDDYRGWTIYKPFGYFSLDFLNVEFPDVSWEKSLRIVE